jgi:hypothetical protein
MSLFNLDTTNLPPNPVIDLSGIKLKEDILQQNSIFQSLAAVDDPELCAIEDSIGTPNVAPSATSLEKPKKKVTYKPRSKKTDSAGVVVAQNKDGLLVASFDGVDPLTQYEESVHDFTINESLFKPEELELNPVVDVFIKNSKVKNDELVKYYIIKYKICEYNCSGKYCPMKSGLWRRRPAYLILNRKNNKQYDLSIPNISLICPNCYVQDKGTELFNKFKNKTESKCIGCAYPVKKGYELCFVCTNKMNKLSVLSTVDDMAELTLRSSVAQVPKSNTVIQDGQNTFGLATFGTDIDKELQELGIKLANTCPVDIPAGNIDIDAELAGYKSILDSEFESGVKPTRRQQIPNGVVHYTRHKKVVSVENSALNTDITPELLNQLADI